MTTQPLLERIKSELQVLALDYDENEMVRINMPNSQTNEYQEITDRDGRSYLIRINGCLWAPFSRETESNNLALLRGQNIQTSVLYNGDGFQICRLPEGQRFFSITDQAAIENCLERIAQSIRTYQQVTQFQNQLSARELVENAFRSLPKERQQQLATIHQIIMIFICHIETDGFDKVSSHNDLLPSSIFDNNGNVIIVDWEYSARNHPYYDLAHLSVHSSLTSQQDDVLLRHHNEPVADPSVVQRQSFIYLKVVLKKNPQITGSDNKVFYGDGAGREEQTTLLRKAGDHAGRILEGGTDVVIAPVKWLAHMQENW
ncbi:unnamed protein product [Rotaria magnacalcarata]